MTEPRLTNFSFPQLSLYDSQNQNHQDNQSLQSSDGPVIISEDSDSSSGSGSSSSSQSQNASSASKTTNNQNPSLLPVQIKSTASILYNANRFGLYAGGIIDMPSLYIKGLPFVYKNRQEQLPLAQQSQLKNWELASASTDLILNQYLAINHLPQTFSDTTYSNVDLAESSIARFLRGGQDSELGMTYGTLQSVSALVSGITTPLSAKNRVRVLNSYTNQIGQHDTQDKLTSAYALSQSALAGGRMNGFLDAVAATTTRDPLNSVVDDWMSQIATPQGYTHDEFREGLEDLQGYLQTCDANILDMASYLEEIMPNADFSEDDLNVLLTTSELCNNRVGSSSALSGTFEGVQYLQAGLEQSLILESQYLFHNSINQFSDNPWLHTLGMLPPAINLTSDILDNDRHFHWKSHAFQFGASALTWQISEAVQNDVSLRNSAALGLTELGLSYYYPTARAVFESVQTKKYARDENGDYDVNPILGPATTALDAVNFGLNFTSAYSAGFHTRKYTLTKEPKELIPLGLILGAQIIDTSTYAYLSSPQKLPSVFENELPEGVSWTGMQGLRNPMYLSLGATAAGLGFGCISPEVQNVSRKLRNGLIAPLYNQSVGRIPALPQMQEKDMTTQSDYILTPEVGPTWIGLTLQREF